MRSSLTLPVTVALALASSARALSHCAIFDAEWNLYLLGGTTDVNIGQASSFNAPSAQTLTASGRPPYTGSDLTCHLSQFNNAFYLLGADASNPGDVYIYNVAGSSWSTQSTTGAPSFASAGSILDHDTNVFFTLAGEKMTQLDLSAVTNAASGGSLAWEGVGDSAIESGSYVPTMALASNHIMFHGAPDVAPGSAEIFVIHYASWQAAPQPFPSLNGGAAFPDGHGQATSFWLDSTNAQLQYAFVPDDFSGTFIITHWTNPGTAGSTDDAPSGILNYINSTQVLPAPSSKDAASSYAASNVGLAQLTSTGDLYYLPAFSASGGYSIDDSATWAKVGYSLAGGVTASSAAAAPTSSSVASSITSGASAAASSGAGRASSASIRASGVGSSASASASAVAGGGGSGAGLAVDFRGVGGLTLTAFVGLGALLLL